MKLTLTLGSGDTTAILKEWAEKKYGLAVEEVTSGYSTIPKIEVEMCAKEDASQGAIPAPTLAAA